MAHAWKFSNMLVGGGGKFGLYHTRLFENVDLLFW